MNIPNSGQSNVNSSPNTNCNLPAVPANGTTIQPLMNADQIFPAELAVINSAKPGGSIYMSQYTLPTPTDGPSVGTPASNAQRDILSAIAKQIKNHVNVYVVADNEAQKNGGTRNSAAIQWLKQQGAYILPYPAQYVTINHTKFIGSSSGYAVVTSANESPHMADSPDNNTGFLFAGAAAHNGIVQAFLPQWNFSAQQDPTDASNYPTPTINNKLIPDSKVTWLNTAPAAETGAAQDQTQIKQAYMNLIQKAAHAPLNPDGTKPYLYLEQWDLSDSDLTNALIQAKQTNPNLDIKVIIDPDQYLWGEQHPQTNGQPSDIVSSYNTLTQAGIQVRFANLNPHPPGPEGKWPQIFHDKWIEFNGQEVINGSGNFSWDSMEGNDGKKHNREVDVDVVDANAAQAYTQKFLNDWSNNSSSDPNAASQGGNAQSANQAYNPGNRVSNGLEEMGGHSDNGYFPRFHTYLNTVGQLFPSETAPVSSPSSISLSQFPSVWSKWNSKDMKFTNDPVLNSSRFKFPF
jgi:hypothetical protein